MNKEMMMQCLHQMDQLFYTVIDEKIDKKQKPAAEQQWDFCFERLEKMINAT